MKWPNKQNLSKKPRDEKQGTGDVPIKRNCLQELR